MGLEAESVVEEERMVFAGNISLLYSFMASDDSLSLCLLVSGIRCIISLFEGASFIFKKVACAGFWSSRVCSRLHARVVEVEPWRMLS